VDDLFAARCSSCHDWATGYAVVRRFAEQSLARVESGSMPQGGPRLPEAEVELLRAWISDGMAQ
jgi:hypothetical protein